MTTVHIGKSPPPPPPYKSLFQPYSLDSCLGRQECRITQKLRNSSSLWSQNNEEPFRSKNLLEYSFSAALILHERKTQEHWKFSSVNFWWHHVKPAIIQFIMKEAISQPFWFVFVFFHPEAKKLNRLNWIQISNQNQPNKQTTSKSSCVASKLNAIQDWSILQSIGFTVCFSRYLMMTLKKNKVKKITNTVW